MYSAHNMSNFPARLYVRVRQRDFNSFTTKIIVLFMRMTIYNNNYKLVNSIDKYKIQIGFVMSTRTNTSKN